MKDKELSEFDKGYLAGLMQAYREINIWSDARIDRLNPGKNKAHKDEIEIARNKLLFRIRNYLPPELFPEIWK